MPSACSPNRPLSHDDSSPPMSWFHSILRVIYGGKTHEVNYSRGRGTRSAAEHTASMGGILWILALNLAGFRIT